MFEKRKMHHDGDMDTEAWKPRGNRVGREKAIEGVGEWEDMGHRLGVWSTPVPHNVTSVPPKAGPWLGAIVATCGST